MKQLPVITPAYRYIEKSFKEWMDVLGYAESSVYYMPIAIRELLYYLEQEHRTCLSGITTEAIREYYYNHLKSRTNQRYQTGALSNEHLNRHLQALEKFCQYLRQSGRLQVGNSCHIAGAHKYKVCP